MNEYDIFLRLGLALAIGFVVGLERGWQEREEEEGHRTAGLRTFALIGLLGGVLGALSQNGNVILLAIGFATTGLTLGAYMMREGVHQHDYSATSFVAALLTLALGAFSVLGDPRAAAGAGVAAVFLLAYKQILHGWLKRLTWLELRAGLVLAAMTFILLPLLPNRPIDPWGALNLHELWLMTVLIAAVSFAGYAAIKTIGPHRGTVLAAAAGGMVSSTAVTLAMGRMAIENPGRANLLSGSILVSGCIMLLRVLVIAGIINFRMAEALLPSLLAATLAMAIVSAILVRREAQEKSTETTFEIKNPFELSAVLRFGLMLTVIMLLVSFARRQFGDQGLFVVSAISGLADVDAMTLTIAKFNEVSDTAVSALLLTILVNTFAKVAYAWWAGGSAVGLRVLAGSSAAAVAGFAALRSIWV